eukprot:CCRYP_008513-RH/>CCRYP_008513-RH protein AED:0.47 eAED:0.47 QI:0/-1/0/1/-1/0/1/0/19
MIRWTIPWLACGRATRRRR